MMLSGNCIIVIILHNRIIVSPRCPIPLFQMLYMGVIVMLLNNYVVEETLMNGSIGNLIEMLYDNPYGSNIPDYLPLYVVIDFS